MPDFLALGTEQQKIRLVDVGPTALISPLCKPSVQPTEKKLRRPSKNKTQHDSVDVTVESWETPIGEQRCKLPHDIQNFQEIQQNIIHIQIFETFSLPFLPSPNPLYLFTLSKRVAAILNNSWTWAWKMPHRLAILGPVKVVPWIMIVNWKKGLVESNKFGGDGRGDSAML